MSLAKTIEKAKDVYDACKQIQVPITAIHTRWGCKPMSGLVLQTVAALKAFGFVEVSGDKEKRTVRLTDDAVKIIRGHPDRRDLLREAALKPSIYSELWEKYKMDGIPPDDILGNYLEWDKKFNPKAIAGFIADFHATIDFAGLQAGDTVGNGDNSDGIENADTPGDGNNNPPSDHAFEMTPPKRIELPKGGADMRTDTFTLEEGPTIALQYPSSLSASSYEDLRDWMEIELRKIKRLIGEKKEQATDTE